MKKFLKNFLLAFVILYTIVNLIIFSINTIKYNHGAIVLAEKLCSLNEKTEELSEEEIEEKIKIILKEMQTYTDTDIVWSESENALNIALYFHWQLNNIEVQQIIIMAILIISATIGCIISLEEKSKIKEVLYFLLLGIIFSIGKALLDLQYYLPELSFLDSWMDTLKQYGLCYVIVYLIIFLIRFYFNKKQTKKINEELKNKKRRIRLKISIYKRRSIN